MIRRSFLTALAFFSLALACFFSSCASTPKKSAEEKELEELLSDDEEYVPEEGSAISIPIPEQTSRSYFSTISQSVMELVYAGSQSSLKQAALSLRKAGNEGYAENEKILLVTVTEMLTMAYPSQSANWELPSVDRSNSYIGALDSAKNSIYDSSTGNSDFLTLVLPSFVLFKNNSVSSYYEQSYRSLSEALSLKPDSVIANYLMALLLQKNSEISAALSYMQKAYSGSRDCVEIAEDLAQLYYDNKRYEESASVISSFVSSNPNNETFLALGAKTYYELSRLDEADSYVQRLLTVAGDNIEYTLLRAKILMKKGDYIKASSLLDVYSRTNRTSRDYLLLRSQLQLEWNKSPSNAADTIAEALALYPTDFEVLLRAAEIASSASTNVGGKTALQLAASVLEKQSDNTTALGISVSELVKASKWSEAYTLSSRLVSRTDISPEVLSQARHTHVDICIAQGRTEEAWNLASLLYGQNSKDETNQQTYIKTLIATGRYETASSLINSLLTSSSARMKSFLYYQRSRLDATEEAVLADLRSSLTSNPRNEDALYRLYELYYQKSDWRRAQYYLKQVVALNPNDARLLRLNAELDTLLGK